MNMEDAVRKARLLCDTKGKREVEVIQDKDGCFYLCATPLAIEENLDNAIFNCFKALGKAIPDKAYSEEDTGDYIAEVRDTLLDCFERLAKCKIVYGYEEY